MPAIVIPLVIPEVPFDDEMQQGLKPIYAKNFQENFSDSRNIDVMVVTNRKGKTKFFGCSDAQFGVEIQANSQFGLCKINVPKNHVIGEIPIAKSSRESSHDYFKVLSSKALDSQSFLDIIKKSRRTPLVFVHGFNVRYQEAILRAAQIAYDLKYQGPVIIFSWPAGAGDGFFDDKLFNKTYEKNAVTAQGSIEPFKKFLMDFKTNNIKINLGVHSMGHQVVLPALKSLGESNEQGLIRELILNAPDYNVEEFTNATAMFKTMAERVTLYCSYNDKAMFASRTMNDNERMGACSYSEDIDSINVSLVDDATFALGHGYYSSRAILNDIFQLLLGIDAEKRLSIRRSEPNSTEKYFLRP